MSTHNGVPAPVPRSAAGDLRIEVLDAPEQLAGIGEDWEGLVRRSPQNVPFLTREWLELWWRSFGGDATPRIVTVRRGPELLGAAPMAYRRVRRRGVWCEVGRLWSNPFSNRTQILAAEPVGPVVEALVDHWLHQDPPWDFLRLEPLPLDCAVTRALCAALATREVPFGVAETLRSPYLELPGTWEDLLAGLGSRFRKTLRREVRAARATRRIRTVVANDPDAVEDAFAIARAGRFHVEGTSLASSPARAEFYRRLAHVAHRRGGLLLAFLECDRQPVAFEYNLHYGGVVYALKSGYLPAFGRHSPGRVLTHDLLRRMIGSGVREYDLMGADEEYKLRWTQRVRVHGRITVFSRRLLPRTEHFVSYRVRPWIKTTLPWTVEARRGVRKWWVGLKPAAAPGA